MRKLTILFAIIIFALSFSAFKKNDKAPSKTAMIAAKTWKMSGPFTKNILLNKP